MRYLFLFLLCASLLSAQDWVKVEPPDGAFSIEMPGTPKEMQKPVASDVGNLTVYLYIYEEENSGYIVSYNDYPETALQNIVLDSVYNNATRSTLKSTKGTLLSRDTITYQGFSGIELKYTIPGNVLVRARYFLVNNRLFQLMLIGDEESVYNSYGEWFFNSFKVKKSAELTLAEKLFKAIDYSYDKMDNGSYQLTMSFEDKRTHLVHIYPVVPKLTSRAGYDIWATIARYDKALPDSVVQDMFLRNANTEYGHFQSFATDSTYLLVYSTIFHGTLTADIFKTIINDVAAISDYYEAKLTGKDEF